MATIACGFTANVDGIALLDDRLVEQLCAHYAEQRPTPGRPPMALDSWGDVLGAIAWNMQHGSGGEYIVAAGWLLDSIRDMTDWRWTVGGTGLQAALSAAAAGHRAFVNVPAWDEAFGELLVGSGLEAVRASTGPVPVHYILEYQYAGRPNRIILRGTGEFAGGLLADAFAERIAASPDSYDALLVSGYNAADSAAEASLLIEEQVRFLSSLQPGRPHVHLELAASFSAAEQQRTVARFRQYVQSIGCNEDEAGELLGLEQSLLAMPDLPLLDQLERLQRLCGVPYLIVHTSEFAACISEADAGPWAGALRSGTMFAAARAYAGRFCTDAEMRAIVARLYPHKRGSRLAAVAAERRGVCVVPAYAVPEPRGTTGLGDTFTSGLLLAVGGLK